MLRTFKLSLRKIHRHSARPGAAKRRSRRPSAIHIKFAEGHRGRERVRLGGRSLALFEVVRSNQPARSIECAADETDPEKPAA